MSGDSAGKKIVYLGAPSGDVTKEVMAELRRLGDVQLERIGSEFEFRRTFDGQYGQGKRPDLFVLNDYFPWTSGPDLLRMVPEPDDVAYGGVENAAFRCLEYRGETHKPPIPTIVVSLMSGFPEAFAAYKLPEGQNARCVVYTGGGKFREEIQAAARGIFSSEEAAGGTGI